MKKEQTIFITVMCLSILIALMTATIITDNRLYAKIGSSLLGILTGVSLILEIKKNGHLTWQSGGFLFTSLWFILNPWLHITG